MLVIVTGRTIFWRNTSINRSSAEDAGSLLTVKKSRAIGQANRYFCAQVTVGQPGSKIPPCSYPRERIPYYNPACAGLSICKRWYPGCAPGSRASSDITFPSRPMPKFSPELFSFGHPHLYRHWYKFRGRQPGWHLPGGCRQITQPLRKIALRFRETPCCWPCFWRPP